MKINKYKLITLTKEVEFLIYSEKGNAKIPEDIVEIKLVKEGITKQELDEVESYLPIFEFNDFMLAFLPGKVRRTRDKILTEAGVVSWADLETAYFNIRHMRSNFSKRERNLIVEKYSEIINEL